MNSKQLNGLRVLTIAEGEVMGTVARAYVDLPVRRVVGFAIKTQTGFFEPESEPKVDAEKVHTIGSGGLMLDDASATEGATITERLGELATLDDLTGRTVLTVDGVATGGVTSVDFDERSFGLTGLEVSTGMFTGNRLVAIHDVVTIGPEYVIVASVVASDDYAAGIDPDAVEVGSSRVPSADALDDQRNQSDH